MSIAEVLAFMRQHKVAVEASVTADGRPQAAAVGVAITDSGEIVFDTVDTTRKAVNLARNRSIAFVIGGSQFGDQQTVQYEGVADFPAGPELERLKAVYYVAYPDGPSRLSWPGLTYIRVRPTWVRYTDYRVDPPRIEEFCSTDFSTT